MLQRSAYWKRI